MGSVSEILSNTRRTALGPSQYSTKHGITQEVRWAPPSREHPRAPVPRSPPRPTVSTRLSGTAGSYGPSASRADSRRRPQHLQPTLNVHAGYQMLRGSSSAGSHRRMSANASDAFRPWAARIQDAARPRRLPTPYGRVETPKTGPIGLAETGASVISSSRSTGTRRTNDVHQLPACTTGLTARSVQQCDPLPPGQRYVQ
jgi:hypothetical protein